MAVLLPGKFLFLCNPRTASVATSRTLIEIEGAIEVGPHHCSLSQVEDHDGEIVVATVRNPYDALVSWFMHLPETDFAAFLRTYSHYPFLGGDPPDLFWQCDADTRLLRFETLQADLDAFLSGLGVAPLQVFEHNVTKTKTRPWREYYDAEAIAAADERFGHIADKWGYPRLS